jgi:hypothetical protein
MENKRLMQIEQQNPNFYGCFITLIQNIYEDFKGLQQYFGVNTS